MNTGDLSTLLVWGAATAFTIALIAYGVDPNALLDDGSNVLVAIMKALIEDAQATDEPTGFSEQDTANKWTTRVYGRICAFYELLGHGALDAGQRNLPRAADEKNVQAHAILLKYAGRT